MTQNMPRGRLDAGTSHDAHAPTRFFDVSVEDLSVAVGELVASGRLTVRNVTGRPLDVALRLLGAWDRDHGPRTRPSQGTTPISASGSAAIPFRVALADKERQQVMLYLDVFADSGVRLGTQPVDLYFRREGDRRELGGPRLVPATYEELYGEPARSRARGLYVQPMGVPAPMTSEERASLAAVRGRPAPTFEILKPRAPADERSAAARAAAYSISGTACFRARGGSLRGAWNWIVRVWWFHNDDWQQNIGEVFVESNGRWKLDINPATGYQGQRVWIDYCCGGQYVSTMDSDDHGYWWRQDVAGIRPGGHDVGGYTIDLSDGGQVPGLGEVYEWAMQYWWRLATANVNVIRDQPLKLRYPNTSYMCGGTQVWSCASPGGDVWLLARHADAFTVMHELTHQLMYKFWKNQAPKDSSGSHSLDRCYTEGLALSEGFANVVPFWVVDGENAERPSVGGFEIESPDKANICNGPSNETWVAAALWDLLDRHADGQDWIWWIDPVFVFRVFLDNGVKNSITELVPLYVDAAMPENKEAVRGIFRDNTIPVP